MAPSGPGSFSRSPGSESAADLSAELIAAMRRPVDPLLGMDSKPGANGFADRPTWLSYSSWFFTRRSPRTCAAPIGGSSDEGHPLNLTAEPDIIMVGIF